MTELKQAIFDIEPMYLVDNKSYIVTWDCKTSDGAKLCMFLYHLDKLNIIEFRKFYDFVYELRFNDSI